MNRPASKTIFYDYGPILSHNALVSMVIGIRGVGKTYGAKKLAINDWIKTGHQFIYLRRYKTELQNVRTFFTDVSVEYPDWEFRVNGHLAQARTADAKKDDPWHTIGYFIALSNAATKKSVAYPMVRRIIYDEFLLTRGHVRYLANEYHAFLEFVNTVDRYQDRVSVLMLANAVDLANPYFLQWEIAPDDRGIRKYEGGMVVADFPSSDKYAEYARGSRLGKLIAGSEYEKYAVGNQFIQSMTTLVSPKPSDAKYMFTIEHQGIMVSIWWRNEEWYVTRKKVKAPNLYALTVRGSDESARVLAPTDQLVRAMRSAYRNRFMRFDTRLTHTAFQNILAFLNTK